jgi:hypothetical protein
MLLQAEEVSFYSIYQHLHTVLMLGGCLVALIGVARIYYKWNTGPRDGMDNEIIMWAAGAFILFLAGTLSKLIFNV